MISVLFKSVITILLVTILSVFISYTHTFVLPQVETSLGLLQVNSENSDAVNAIYLIRTMVSRFEFIGTILCIVSLLALWYEHIVETVMFFFDSENI